METSPKAPRSGRRSAPLETSLVEWKQADADYWDRAEAALETSLVEWKLDQAGGLKVEGGKPWKLP